MQAAIPATKAGSRVDVRRRLAGDSTALDRIETAHVRAIAAAAATRLIHDGCRFSLVHGSHVEQKCPKTEASVGLTIADRADERCLHRPHRVHRASSSELAHLLYGITRGYTLESLRLRKLEPTHIQILEPGVCGVTETVTRAAL